jgi:hypothetical protein
MTSRRWLGLAVSAAVAASVIFAGASALAASHVTHGNYRGPALAPSTVTIAHGTNYRGPARTPARAAARQDSNVPASVAAQPQPTQRHLTRRDLTQRGSK